MNLLITNYYFLDKIIKQTSKNIPFNDQINKDLVFNCANFLSSSYFYHKHLKDDDLYNSLYSDRFNNFFIDVILEAKKKDMTLEKVIFIYGLYINYYLHNELNKYVIATKAKSTSVDEALNMVDYYIANKNEDINLRKTDLIVYFKDGYKFEKYMDELVHYPLLKNYNLFSSSNYFKKCYKNKYKFYAKNNKRKFILAKIFNKKSYYIYDDKIDTKLINVQKNEYEIDGKKINSSLTDYIEDLKKNTIKIINSINDYLFDDSPNKLRKYFNVPDNKNL